MALLEADFVVGYRRTRGGRDSPEDGDINRVVVFRETNTFPASGTQMNPVSRTRVKYYCRPVSSQLSTLNSQLLSSDWKTL